MAGPIATYLSLTLTEVKSALAIDGTDHDVYLQILLDAGKDHADKYCNLASTVTTIPATIKLWVIRFIAHNFAKRELRLLSESVGGTGKTEWDLEIPPEEDGLWQDRVLPGLAAGW